ncbi:hypothetical protein [Nocardia neocaledoniensis]|uniref:hypothetical protein n=1 Tax=Nocardia neocaledoniensis TaxID=236511 RepID=UPI002453AF3C|nr:hypothetical protein [Nocardia neocaledoniensis]
MNLRLATGATALATVALTFFAGTASAARSADAVGGADDITVTITNTDDACWSGTVMVDEMLQGAILSKDKPSAVLANIEAGDHRVRVHLYVGEGENCTVNTPAVELLDTTVTVGAAAGNPIQELLDAGSAALGLK